MCLSYILSQKNAQASNFLMSVHFMLLYLHFNLTYDNTFDRNSLSRGFFGFPKNSSGVPDSKI